MSDLPRVAPRAPQVLSDDEKRGIYDRFGEAGLKGGFAGAGTGGMGGMQGDFRWGCSSGLLMRAWPCYGRREGVEDAFRHSACF